MMLGAGFVWKPAGELAAAIESGQPAFEHVYGAQFFKHLAAHGDEAAVFNAANEAAVALFLEGRIRFGQIASAITGALENSPPARQTVTAPPAPSIATRGSSNGLGAAFDSGPKGCPGAAAAANNGRSRWDST